MFSKNVLIGESIYSLEINKGKGNEDALKTDQVIINLTNGINLNINKMFEKDGSIKMR